MFMTRGSGQERGFSNGAATSERERVVLRGRESVKKKLTSLVLVAFLVCTVFGSSYAYIETGIGGVNALTHTTLTITTSNTHPAANQGFTLSGTLKAGSTPLAGKKITLARTDPAGAYSQPKSTTTNANGVYTFPRSESRGIYYYTAIFSGDATYAPSLASVKLTVGNLQKSTISIVSTNLAPAVKQSYTLHGVLRNGVSGAPLAEQPIKLNVRLPSGQNVGMSTTTNANGAYTFTRSESAQGSYSYQVSFWGNSHYSGSSTMLELNIGNPIPTTLSLKITNSNPADSQSFTMSGYLQDTKGTPLSGKKISVDVRLPSGSWTSQGLGATTDSNGHYSITTSEQAAGEYRFEVYFLGDGTYAGHGSWALVPIGTLQPTKISATTNVANPVAGKPFTLSGTLTDAKGTPLAGKEIQLYRYAATQPNPPVIFQTRYTDQNGHYSFVLNEPSDKYMYTARFTGDQTYAYSEAVVNLTVGTITLT